MPARRPLSRPAAVRLLAWWAACAVVVTACTTGTDDVTSPTAPSVPVTTTTATTAVARLDLEPDAGALRATVDGLGSEDEVGSAPIRPGVDPDDVLLVGDSVLVLVADDVVRRLDSTVHVDGADCRRLDRVVVGPCGGIPAGAQVTDGVTAVQEAIDALAADDVVPDALVLVLANNSSLTRRDLDEVMDSVGTIPQVWWVNARIVGFGRQDPNNRLLDDLAAADPRAGVVDWFSASEGESWLADNVHPNELGQAALGRLIRDRLRCGCTS